MRSLHVTKESLGFINKLEAKFFKQVMKKILELLNEPAAADASQLKGHEELFRVDAGEYRIIYRFDETTVSILVVDKRNDDQVYKKLGRKNF